MTAMTREPRHTGGLDSEQLERLDLVVARSRAAADSFRQIDDQAAVDRIVWALVVAGLEHAVELARLAMEETGFGVF
jgi:acetaldehyde dehydrogenase / alcohol dehydrogenase